jgi:hypothetical protein
MRAMMSLTLHKVTQGDHEISCPGGCRRMSNAVIGAKDGARVCFAAL